MNRRDFIKITGLGVGNIMLSSTLQGCATHMPEQEMGWSEPNMAEKDIRMKVLSYAVLSPSAHNIQPWMIHLSGTNSFELYVDPERLLPKTDPVYRQIHISQGTFLETLAIAASALGYIARIDYFPQGMYSNTELLDKPVAGIELVKSTDVKKDPLFDYLLLRHSNKREYDNSRLSQSQITELMQFHQDTSHNTFTIDQTVEIKKNMQRILPTAMQIEVKDRQRDLETIKMFRFNNDELRKFRDGFGVAQAGLTGFKKFMVESFFLSREDAEKEGSDFGQQAVDTTTKSVRTTACYAWLTTTNNTRLDQIKVGRDYCRINLKTSAMGLAQHPMSQILQEYDDMLALQEDFKKTLGINQAETVQMLFRLGRAPATPHTPRRLVSQLINKASGA